jgi:5-methylcytosine-specific restriction endonuclease McrA
MEQTEAERRTFAITEWAWGRITDDELDRRLAAAHLPPKRPARRMPTLRAIARHWDLGDHPACFRCGDEPPVEGWGNAHGWLERAHLIDRWAGGLDLVTNIVPLCPRCHRRQPIFEPGDEDAALTWAAGATV